MAAISRMASAPWPRARPPRGGACGQYGQRYGGAGALEIRQTALEKRLVGERAESGGSPPLIGAGDAGRSEIVRENALAGRRLLDLRDDGGRPCRQGSAEIAARRKAQRGLAFPCF